MPVSGPQLVAVLGSNSVAKRYGDYNDYGMSDYFGMAMQFGLAEEQMKLQREEGEEERKLTREKMAAESGVRDAQVKAANSATAVNEQLLSDTKNTADAKKRLAESQADIAATDAKREEWALKGDEVMYNETTRQIAQKIAGEEAYLKALAKFQTDTVWDTYMASAEGLNVHAVREAGNRMIHNMTLAGQSSAIRRADAAAAIMEGKLDEFRLSGTTAEQAGRDYATAVLDGKNVPPPVTSMGSLIFRSGTDRMPYPKEYITRVTDPDQAAAMGFLEAQGKTAQDIVSGKIKARDAKTAGPPGLPSEMAEVLLMDMTAVSETARELQAAVSGQGGGRYTKEQAEARIMDMKYGFQSGFAQEFNKRVGYEAIPAGATYTAGSGGPMSYPQRDQAATTTTRNSYKFPEGGVFEGTGEKEIRINAAVENVRQMMGMDNSRFVETVGGAARSTFGRVATHDPIYSTGGGMTYNVATETNRRITAGTALKSLYPGVQGDMVSAAERAYGDPMAALSYFNMITGPEAIKDFNEILNKGPGAADAWHKWQGRIGAIEPKVRTDMMKWVASQTPESLMQVTQAQKTQLWQSTQAATPASSDLLGFDTDKGMISKAADFVGLDIPDIFEPPTITGLSEKGQANFDTPEEILNTTDPAVRDLIYGSGGYGTTYSDFKRFLNRESVAPTTQPADQGESALLPYRKNIPRSGDVLPEDANRYGTTMVRSYLNNGDIHQMQKSMRKEDLELARSIARHKGVNVDRVDQELGLDLGTIGPTPESRKATDAVLEFGDEPPMAPVGGTY